MMENKSIGVFKPAQPTGGGAIRGIGETFQANAFTGSASLSIPIPTSACRGFEPQLSLDYSSGSGNGPFGIGFSLAIPNISRKTAIAIPKYDETDRFVISSADDLVPAEGSPRTVTDSTGAYFVSTYRPRTEGLFARIEKWVGSTDGTIHWRVTTHDNITTLYGQSADTRIADPADSTHVFQWLAERSYDARGNQIVYQYQVDQGNSYIAKIKYGNYAPNTLPGSDDWHFEVDFTYSTPAERENLANDTGTQPDRSRPDPFSSYKAGFELRSTLRCIRIAMSHRFAGTLAGALFEVSAIEFDYAANTALSLLQAIRYIGYNQGTAKELPPLEFIWSKFFLDDNPKLDVPDAPTFKALKLNPGQPIPGFLESGAYQMIDLYGEGLPGILYTDANSVLYAHPLGDGAYAAAVTPQAFPIEHNLQGGQNLLMDLGGDGKLDLVVTSPTRSGYYEAGRDGSWEPYRSFVATPTDLLDPQRQMVDVTGDGLADLMLFEGDTVRVYPSTGRLGYGAPFRQRAESALPITSSPSAREALHFTNLFGDGGSHLVRIRNGSVECWPNLGYGRFGPKVELANAPRFTDELDASRLFLTDIDGTGPTDLVYAYPDHIDLYRNESGNRFSDPVSIPLPGVWNDLSQISFADVLGNGTACLVFTSPQINLGLDHQYYDFTGGVKPYLLSAVDNHMGATTLIHYSPSTQFYLADEQAGTPWVTRLPFPVQVVAQVETLDAISGSRLTTNYSYHHGYYDPIDREFRGFGRVDRRDAESFENFSGANGSDPSLDVPPVLTKTWYHTGALAESGLISHQFGTEYYAQDMQAEPLADSTLDPAFEASPENLSEGCRALQGHVLREEIYGLDEKQNPALANPNLAEHPYRVTGANYFVRLLQPKAGQPYAVCLPSPRETITYHYERNPADPRISHELTLEVDDFGNMLQSAAIAYGRRQPDPDLPAADQAKQTRPLISYTVTGMTNAVNDADNYHAPLVAETQTYECTAFTPENSASRFSVDEWTRNDFALFSSAEEIPYEQAANLTSLQKRQIEHERTFFLKDDLSGLLPLGRLEPLALPGESCHLAFTPGLLAQVYTRNDETLLAQPADVLAGGGAEQGGYVDLEGDGRWWIPSGRFFFSPDSSATPEQELAYAQSHFFLPQRIRDPFHTPTFSTESVLTYDDYNLLIVGSRDALGNTLQSEHDYRVLQPSLVTDPNGNRVATAYDALGMVVATAVMGKAGETLGDLLSGFEPDLTLAELQAFSADPQGRAEGLLGQTTTRLVYDLERYQRAAQPPFVATLTRETHVSDLNAPQDLQIRVGFVYSDGFGRVLQSKMPAEPGDAPSRAANLALPGGDVAPGALALDSNGQPVLAAANPRWVGSGRMLYNNKGLPVKQYVPFFSSTHLYETELEMTDTGVSPVLFYDPVERLIATLHPEHTYEKGVFTPWRHAAWDANDTLLLDPRTDDDIQQLTAAYFKTQPAGWQTWLQQRGVDPLHPPADDPSLPPEEKAVVRSLPHAATPALAYFDPLGHAFLTLADNGKDANGQAQQYRTLVELDLEGNSREQIDANGRSAMRHDYDMTGNCIHQHSMDAGERWILNDVLGKPLYTWDSRGHQFRTTYDAMRRPMESFVREAAGSETVVERLVYGESQPNPAASNLLGKVYQIFDEAGVLTNAAYDFKGNVLRTARQVLPDPQSTTADSESFAGSTRYDALNRPIQVSLPHSDSRPFSILQHGYNEANLLTRIDAWLGQTSEPAELLNPASANLHAVTQIDYNARGQRTQVTYGNGVVSTFQYDPLTLQLIHLQTLRGAQPLQDLRYTCDPVGNIITLRDAAQQQVFFNNQVVSPQCDYRYDAIYQLIWTAGREHIGQLAQPQTSWDDAFRMRQPQPGDGQAMRNYSEVYQYDAVGNFEQLIHQAAGGSWTRTYAYHEASRIVPDQTGNRLSSTTVGAANEPCSYDAHGNLTRLPHLPLLQWDYRDQLQASAGLAPAGGGTPETTWYLYDASGQRVVMLTQAQAAAHQTAKRKAQRLYLSGCEIYREYQADGSTIRLQRETLRIMDDERCVVLVETRSQGTDKGPPQLIRYQFGNQLASVNLELDERAQIISYEEYTPFGSTSYQAVRSQTETPKRYRYSGKERDEATGFYYYGARYYAPWLGRWTSPDPAGTLDGLNLYVFVNNNPVTHLDIGGMAKGKNLATKKGAGGKKASLTKIGGVKLKKAAAKKPPGNKIVRKGFDTAAKRIARIVANVSLNANLTKLDKAQPHRVPYTNLRDRVQDFVDHNADEAELIRWTDRFTVKEAKLEQLEAETNLDPNAILMRKLTVLSAVQEAQDKIQTERDTLISLRQKGASAAEMHDQAQNLVTALNTYPLNIPDLGPHSDTNAAVQDHLHLNVSESGTLTPTSQMAGAMTPGKVSKVAVDASSQYLVLTTGELFPLTSLSKKDRKRLDLHGYHPIPSITTKTHDIFM